VFDASIGCENVEKGISMNESVNLIKLSINILLDRHAL
jgi:hypothetical protein